MVSQNSVEKALRSFSWSNYGFDDVDNSLGEGFDQWVGDLSEHIFAVMRKDTVKLLQTAGWDFNDLSGMSEGS